MTKDEAKKYIDNYLSHIIEMTEYGNWFSSQIKELVNIAKSKCDEVINSQKYVTTKKSCNDCQDKIDEILNDLEDKITSLIRKEIVKLNEVERRWLEENVAEPLGISFNFPERATKLLLLIPIATAGIVGEYGKTVSDRLGSIYNQKIMSSYVSGIPFEELNSDTRFNTFFRGLEADSETLGESLSTQYDRIVYTANDKKIKGYIWQCVLDGRTCIACASLSGTIYDNIQSAPVYPLHDRDRCSLLPITEDMKDVIPKNYSEWFDTQSSDNKRKILGKTRFQLYEQGMKIKNFVNNGKITPLKDLKIEK